MVASAGGWLTAAAILLATYPIIRTLYHLFLSPLRKIPGPFLAKVTSYYLILIDTAGHRTSTIHQLHKKYGQVVQIGPNELSFSNSETIKELYAPATPYLKAPWYEKMSQEPIGIFSLTNRKAHNERRRLLSHVFSQGNLLNAEPLIGKHAENLRTRVLAGAGQPLNMHLLFRKFSLDVVGELFLGKSFGAVNQEAVIQFLEDMDLSFLLNGVNAAFPWVYYIISRLPLASLQHHMKSIDRIKAYGEAQYWEYIDRYGRDSGRRDLLTKFMTIKADDGDTSLTDIAAHREIGNLIFAGTDTTSTTLTYLFWELARHQDWQDRLRKELKGHLSNENIPTLREVQDLPILDAIVNEALRLHPAAPASLPRVVPPGGRMLNGHFIPENTVVSMQCYTTQRDPEAFPDPETFNPDRWLDPSKVTDQMRELFMPYSRGTRSCLGQGLAQLELKLTTALLVRDFYVKLGESATEDCMTMTDHFLVIPKGGKCELIFEVAT